MRLHRVFFLYTLTSFQILEVEKGYIGGNMMKNKKTNASTLVLINVLEGIRTPDPRLRRPLLYPAELRTPILLKQAGLVGFEPTNAGIKILCLTAWR